MERNIFEVGFAVEPLCDGSFVVHGKVQGERWAFSSVGDLLAWLTKQAANAPAMIGTGERQSFIFSVRCGEFAMTENDSWARADL